MLRFLTLSLVATISLTLEPAHAATWLIKPDGTGDAPTIQAAVDSAAYGDTLLLANGEYSGVGNTRVEINTSLYIRSESDDPTLCVIRPSGERGLWFKSISAPGELRGVTITEADGGALITYGNTLVENCVFVRNHDDHNGAALGISYGTVSIRDCDFRENLAGDGGAAIYCLARILTISNCQFIDNSAGQSGGAILCAREPIDVMSNLTVEDCAFIGNSSGDGGGAIRFRNNTSGLLRNSLFIDNSSGGPGGAILAQQLPFSVGSIHVDVRGCTIIRNNALEGAGIALDGATADVFRTIIAFSTNGEAATCGVTLPMISCSNIYGNADGDWVGCIAGMDSTSDNFSLDPGFCDEMGDDFTLQDSSPCAPGNHPDGANCGLIGAFPVACGGTTATESASWTEVKEMFR